MEQRLSIEGHPPVSVADSCEGSLERGGLARCTESIVPHAAGPSILLKSVRFISLNWPGTLRLAASRSLKA